MAFIHVPIEERNELSDLHEDGYQFDWTIPSSANAQLLVYSVKSDIAGLVEFEPRVATSANYMFLIEVADAYKGTGVAGKLLAAVGKDSLERGFEGFVFFEPKTNLANYYVERYGAKHSAGHYYYFDTEATLKLIDVYLKGEWV